MGETEMRGNRRILILAPHPDDEVVACGIAALRARSAGVRLSVLYLTTGVPPRETLWPWRRASYYAIVRRRRSEARAAASFLGLEALRFREIPARTLRHDLDAAAVDVADTIAAWEPEAIWVTAFEGAHQDHDAANALAARFSGELPVWEFAAYHFAGGRVTSNRFIENHGRQMDITASVWEAERKRDALRRYRSERGNLRHIRPDRECGRPLPAYDYGARPHRGRLFRERFHRLPFRHPRIDFVPSGEIYADIGRWVSGGRPGAAPFEQRPGDETGQADREFAGALHKAQG